MAAPKRRQREIERTREDILQAAACAFAKAGYARATMQDIAREAGYTAASLYTYFRSKEEIFEALLDVLVKEYVHTFEEPMPEGLSFRQRFELLLIRQLEVADSRRPLFATFQLLASHGEGVESSFARCFHESFEKRVQALGNWFRKNAQPEEIGNLDPDLVARYLFGFVFGLIHGWMHATPAQRLVERASIIVNLFFHGVSGPPSSPRKS